MPCSAPFHPDDHGAAGPYLERLRVAVVKSCGLVDVGCSGKGSGQITFCSDGRTTAYVNAPVTAKGNDRQVGHRWRIEWYQSEDECFDTMCETLNAIRRRWGGANPVREEKVAMPENERLADRIRQHVRLRIVEPARQAGVQKVTVRAGAVVRELDVRDRAPAVCSALASKKFLDQAGVAVAGTARSA